MLDVNLTEDLRKMNLEIQQEQKDLKEDSRVLSDRKKELRKKELEYLKLSLQQLDKN